MVEIGSLSTENQRNELPRAAGVAIGAAMPQCLVRVPKYK